MAGGRDVKWPGITLFIASLLSLGTGLVFSVMVARRLALSEYGIWQLYSTVVMYLILPGYIVDFWLTRDLGRGKPMLNTGLVTSALLGITTSLILVAVSSTFGPAVEVDTPVLLALMLYVIVLCLSNSVYSASVGAAPELQSLGMIVQELVKVLVGVVLVVWLEMGLLGAILSTDIAFAAKCLAVYVRMPQGTKGIFDPSKALLWFRNGLVPLISLLPNLVAPMDLLMLSWITNSPVAVAYFGLSKTISAIAGYPGLLGVSLYSSLLGREGEMQVQKSVRLVMTFAFPMAAGMIVLALPITYIFGQSYASTATSLQLLSAAAFFSIVSTLAMTILLGSERVDTKDAPTPRQLLKSNLVVPRVAELTIRSAYVLISLVALGLTWGHGSSPELAVTTLAATNLLSAITLSLVLWILSKKAYKDFIPWRDVVRYVFATGVMVALLLLCYPAGAIDVRISEVIANLFPIIVTGAIVYFGTLLLIDKKFRDEGVELLKFWQARVMQRSQADCPRAGTKMSAASDGNVRRTPLPRAESQGRI